MKKIIFLSLIIILLLPSFCFGIETRTENTVINLEFTTLDKDDLAFTASKIKYRIDDVASGTQITGNTDVTPTSSVTEITITAAENAIKNDALSYEEKLVSYQIYVGTTVVKSDEYRYRLKNLVKVPL